MHEGLDDFAYYININSIPEIHNAGELMDILFDDYALDSEYYDDDIVKVYAPSNDSVKKIEKCLKLYGASVKTIKDIINKINVYENKKYFNNKNMKRCINESELMRRRMNESLRRSSELSNFNRYNNVLENYKINMFGDFDPIFEAEDKDIKDDCKCRYNGKLISKMNKAEKNEAKKDIREEIKNIKLEIKNLTKAGKSTKMLDKKLDKLEHIFACLMGKCEKMNESDSVSSSFMKRRCLFENEEIDNNDETIEADDNDDNDTLPQDNKEENVDDKDEYEDVEMKAIVLTVLKKNIETVKSAMIEAGVSEDDINIDEMDDDTSDDDKVDIRVDVNSIDSLKTYLESVGINLEEELDGEIVNTNDDSNDDSASDDNSDDSDDSSEDDFDDLFADEN